MTEEELERVFESRFYNEWDLKYINMEGRCMSLSYYILLMCIDDLDLYLRQGKIPHKAWRIGAIKQYFNISGKTKDVLVKLREIKNIVDE